MALRKPLVLNSGQYEQLQSGDTLDISVAGGADETTLTNGGGSALAIGQAVYISAANTVQLARANASGTKDPIGLVAATSIAAGASGAIRKDGSLSATTAQWDAVTGQTGGLTSGAMYFLSEATAGGLTTTAPTSGWNTPVGRAISTTELDITIERSTKL